MELQDRLGDGLRAVARYDRQGADVAYRRDDLAAEAGTVDPALDGPVPQRIPVLEVAGEDHAGSYFLLHPVDEALLVMTPITGDAGRLVTVDSGIDADVEAIVGSLRKHA